MFKSKDMIRKSRNNEGKALSSTLERIMAEIVDYKNTIKSNENELNNLKVFLNNINTNSYIKSDTFILKNIICYYFIFFYNKFIK